MQAGEWLNNFHLTDNQNQDYIFFAQNNIAKCLKPALNRKLSDTTFSKHTDLQIKILLVFIIDQNRNFLTLCTTHNLYDAFLQRFSVWASNVRFYYITDGYFLKYYPIFGKNIGALNFALILEALFSA